MTIPAVSLAVMFALTQPMSPRADFELRYDPATQAETRAIRRKVVALDLLAKVPELQVLERLLVLPQPISVRAAECPGDASMYLPAAREIRICYAVLQTLWTRGERLADDAAVIDARAREAFAQRYVWANLRFILAHEVGHALIEELDLPVTGRVEDAVDQFASLMMQRVVDEGETAGDAAWNLRMAAVDLLAGSKGHYPLEAFADAHAFGEQRYFNLQCLLYGTDPVRYAELVEGGDLPADRARGCERETRRVGAAWWRLLQPYLDPAVAAELSPPPR